MQVKRKFLGVIAAMFALSLLTVVYGIAVQPAASVSAQEPVDLVAVHTNAEDYIWDSAAVTTIALSDSGSTVTGAGATISGSIVTITTAGNYSLSGTLTAGQIVVDTDDEALVRVILNGVNISSTTSAPIFIANAEETMIVLADNSANVVSDAANYVYASAEEDEPNAAIFSKSNLTIYGNGTLTVNANFNDGITSKDGLVITSGTITVNAVDDGVRGKDYLVVENGSLTVNAGGDALKSDNEEDAGTGYLSIVNGTISVNAGGDALSAVTNVMIADGQFALVSGGGSAYTVAADSSAKGIKADVSVQIDGGTFTVNSADDALHSNGTITVNGGVLTIAANDDGIHADAAVTINGGDINITDSYEGIESGVITLNGGTVHLISSDDGVNVSSGNGGMMMGGQVTATDYVLHINGGYLYMDANGDGLDSNGAIEMTGGVVVVNGPTEQMNGSVDYDAWFTMTGGWLVTAGSSGMAEAPDTSSTQASVLINFTTMQAAGTLINIASSDGTNVLTFAPTKQYQSITFSSPELTQGATYTVSLGGSADGTATDGVYSGGSYSGGMEYGSFTVSSVVTMLGNAGGFGGGRGGRGGGRP